jgi:hypothetical protein
MRTQLLTDEMLAHFSEVDRLAQRHREALEYIAASERMAFLHDRLRVLHRALVELRIVTELLRLLSSEPRDDRMWEQTCAELQGRAPIDILAPGGAIVSAGIDLLRLVDYTGASTALILERRDRTVDAITHLSNALDVEIIWQTVARIADSDGLLRPDSIAVELGWIDERPGVRMDRQQG